VAREKKKVLIEDVRIIYRNFEGREKEFNEKGTRNFGVILPKDLADKMARDGWNVKLTKVYEEGDEPEPWLPVEARYDTRPPQVVLLTSTSRTLLNEDNVEILDWAEIETADVSINGSVWNDEGRVKAYLKSLFVTIVEDELDRKYNTYGNPPSNQEDDS